MIRRATWLLGALLICATAPAQGVDEKRAESDLQKAMELAAKGRYRAAHAAYARIAKKYADTGPGRIAAQRAGDTAFLGWCYLEQSGPSLNRVDVVMMGDAFTLDQQDRFDKIAESVPNWPCTVAPTSSCRVQPTWASATRSLSSSAVPLVLSA